MVINAQFNHPVERVAFSLSPESKANLPEIQEEPLELVVKVLQPHKTYLEVANNLPDIDWLELTNQYSRVLTPRLIETVGILKIRSDSLAYCFPNI